MDRSNEEDTTLSTSSPTSLAAVPVPRPANKKGSYVYTQLTTAKTTFAAGRDKVDVALMLKSLDDMSAQMGDYISNKREKSIHEMQTYLNGIYTIHTPNQSTWTPETQKQVKDHLGKLSENFSRGVNARITSATIDFESLIKEAPVVIEPRVSLAAYTLETHKKSTASISPKIAAMDRKISFGVYFRQLALLQVVAPGELATNGPLHYLTTLPTYVQLQHISYDATSDSFIIEGKGRKKTSEKRTDDKRYPKDKSALIINGTKYFDAVIKPLVLLEEEKHLESEARRLASTFSTLQHDFTTKANQRLVEIRAELNQSKAEALTKIHESFPFTTNQGRKRARVEEPSMMKLPELDSVNSLVFSSAETVIPPLDTTEVSPPATKRARHHQEPPVEDSSFNTLLETLVPMSETVPPKLPQHLAHASIPLVTSEPLKLTTQRDVPSHSDAMEVDNSDTSTNTSVPMYIFSDSYKHWSPAFQLSFRQRFPRGIRLRVGNGPIYIIGDMVMTTTSITKDRIHNMSQLLDSFRKWSIHDEPSTDSAPLVPQQMPLVPMQIN